MMSLTKFSYISPDALNSNIWSLIYLGIEAYVTYNSVSHKRVDVALKAAVETLNEIIQNISPFLIG